MSKWPDFLMRERTKAEKALNDESEAVRTAAEIILRKLPEPPPQFIEKSQPTKD